MQKLLFVLKPTVPAFPIYVNPNCSYSLNMRTRSNSGSGKVVLNNRKIVQVKSEYNLYKICIRCIYLLDKNCLSEQ